MKKRFTKIDWLIVLLCIVCTVLTVLLCIAKPQWILFVAVFFIIIAAILLKFIYRIRKTFAKVLHGKSFAEGETQQRLSALPLPALVLADDHILWYNPAFRDDVLNGEDKCLLPYDTVFPLFNKEKCSKAGGLSLQYGDKMYTAYGSSMFEKEELFLVYFVNDTHLKQKANEYDETRPCVMLITIDTFDEILKEMKESDRARILGEIDEILENFISQTTGVLRRMSSSRYFVVMEERHIQEVIKKRFEILDKVRSIAIEGGNATLSIGVGRLGKSLQECEAMAVQALDMALGRGGDQAAVKSKDGFEFYGGVSRSIEKSSKVRSRIISKALCDLINQSSKVIVTGHKMSDLDSIGASTGVWRICKMCKKPAAIMVDESRSLAGNLIEQLKQSNVEFVSPSDAEDMMDNNTLLIIVDTHLAGLLENVQVYNNAKNVVVIDHHRRCVGYIEDAVVFYHEPAASSASELVCELLQYVDNSKEDKLTSTEAQALLAGIMLDTRNFSLHTGVRTFEASAYLRRMGAQTQAVKKLFNSSFESYMYKSQLVTDAEIFKKCAIVTEESLPSHLGIVVPQAANDLLTIDGVQASFVAVNLNGQITISARSMGEVNVQVIMEKLGGGGHLTMAGAQLKNTTLEEAKRRLLVAIAEYRETELK